MRTITAPERYHKTGNEVNCFLAGGITGCHEWQDRVIEIINGVERTDYLNIYNPRQKRFDVTDPKSTEKQIKWEFDYLSDMDIFSMYFAESESVQPICMYELGRYLSEMMHRFPKDYKNRIIISVEDGYQRTSDVIYQSSFALGVDIVQRKGNPIQHAIDICNAYQYLKEVTT